MPAGVAELADGAHVVQFYSEDEALVDVVARLVGTALVTGDSAIVLATRIHEQQVRKRLQDRGLDVIVALEQGRYTAVEAGGVLRRFAPNGMLDRAGIAKSIRDLIAGARSAAEGERVVVFGELVGVLAREGRFDTALQIERIWNEVMQETPVALCCGYPMAAFRRERAAAPFLQVCGQHSHVFPAERRLRRRRLPERQAYAADQQHQAKGHADDLRARDALLEEGRRR